MRLIAVLAIVGGCHRWLPSVPDNASAQGPSKVCASFAHEPDVYIDCGIEVGRELADRGAYRDAFDFVHAATTHNGPTSTNERASSRKLREATDQLEEWGPQVWRDVERLVRQGRGDLALRRAAVICNALAGPGARMRDIRDAPPTSCPFRERLEELRGELFERHERIARSALATAPGAAAVHACWVSPSSELCRQAAQRHRQRAILAHVDFTIEASPSCQRVTEAVAGVYGEPVALPIRTAQVRLDLTECAVEETVTRSEGICYHRPGETRGTDRHNPQLEATPATRIITTRRLTMRGRVRSTSGVSPLSSWRPIQLSVPAMRDELRAPTCTASSGDLPDRGVGDAEWDAMATELRHRLRSLADRAIQSYEKKRYLEASRASANRASKPERARDTPERVETEDRMALELLGFTSPHAYAVPQAIKRHFDDHYGFLSGAARHGTPRVEGVGRVLAFVWLGDRAYAGGELEGVP